MQQNTAGKRFCQELCFEFLRRRESNECPHLCKVLNLQALLNGTEDVAAFCRAQMSVIVSHCQRLTSNSSESSRYGRRFPLQFAMKWRQCASIPCRVSCPNDQSV